MKRRDFLEKSIISGAAGAILTLPVQTAGRNGSAVGEAAGSRDARHSQPAIDSPATSVPDASARAADGPATIAQSKPADELIEKVKRAMLTMQRDAWEQGVAAQALLESGERELVVLMAKEAVVRQLEDGRLAVISCNEGVTDPAANGEAVLYAAEATGDPALRAAAARMLDYLVKRAPRREDGTLYHVANKRQVWVDSMYMAPPFLAVAGEPEEAVRQVEGIRKLLWEPRKKLFSHIWDDDLKGFFRPDFWGVGNGWAAAGMARIIQALPDRMGREKKRLAGYVKDVVDGCLAFRRPDGLFHDVVDKPATFVETNLAQMLAYTIYRGVRGGWLGRTYLRQAEVMRDAARRKVDAYGYVQGVCGSPTFESAGTATEGQAFFLLMEAAAF
jgi:rhamnogalacturonyl hydrolase YesR